jgi:nucleolar protein 4
MAEAEIEKRQASFNARRTILRSNPSLYISKTRLSIRQLPLYVTDRTLKRLGIHAVRIFNDEVAAGEREALSRAEEMDETLSPSIEGKKKKRGERDTVVVQSKIVRQVDRVDPGTGLGKSKGYGFLEMRTHKDALKVLRWANNNPDLGPLLYDWHKVETEELLERTKKQVAAIKEGAGVVKAKDGDADTEAPVPNSKTKTKEDLVELEGMVRNLEQRVRETGDKSLRGKTLIIEFSVENVQVSALGCYRDGHDANGSGRQATSGEDCRGALRRDEASGWGG